MHSTTSSELRPTIDQNCSAVCTNKGGHRDAFSNQPHEAPRVLRGLLSRRPLSLEWSERWGLFFVDVLALLKCHHCSGEYEQLRPYWHTSRGVVYTIISSKFVLLHVHCTCTNGLGRWYCLAFLWVCELTVNNSCILATLSHDYDIKHTCYYVSIICLLSLLCVLLRL